MGMLCAPVRDDKIQELKSQKQVVEIFKGKMSIFMVCIVSYYGTPCSA